MYTLDQQTWNSVETKTGFDETIRRKINQIDSEGDGVVEKALADDQGNVISETYVKNTPTLDFLFVDAWNNDPVSSNNFTPDLPIKGMIQLSNNYHADQIWVANYDVDYGDFIPYQGAGSDPYVPISQTTIFIHPTTFQRYLFNGTEMVEYDDVNNVVPKWLKYEALLTQTGEDAPVARVLNQDERDYLGDIVWSRLDVGKYSANSHFFDETFTIPSVNLSKQGKDGDNPTQYGFYVEDDGELLLETWYDGNQQEMENSKLPLNIAIKQRVRGNPPKLLTAETNTTGYKVILTFDKEMSGYGFNPDNLVNSLNVSDSENGSITMLGCNVKGSIVEFNMDAGIVNNVTLNYFLDSPILIESRDYGLLQQVENFPVTNNVIAEEE